ncbi:MAG: pyridoxamine 5'-phosphate oxidase family protein [Lachnospiraceae bacterium]|nr:pyridoxamine 5'-phosphate oxidase family protein [Lachnospiraceae bacterium]
MKEIDAFLGEAGVFYLATVDGDQPKNRPLGARYIFDGRMMFAVGDHKNVYRQMQANPKVEIVACSNGNWLRYTGKAVFETDPKYTAMAIESSPFLKDIYNEKTGLRLAMFHLEDEKAVLLDIGGNAIKTYE